jgi:PHD/YefM family antitoxin component YafN of YafNO toxin-antitoxin module
MLPDKNVFAKSRPLTRLVTGTLYRGNCIIRRRDKMAKVRYIIDEKGKKKAVLMDIKEYQQVMQRLEDLEDALDLDIAVRETRNFKDYQVIREGLKKAGRL